RRPCCPRAGSPRRASTRALRADEDLTNALLVRLAGDASDVVLGDRPERDAVPAEHSVPPDGTRRRRVPQGAVEIETDRVAHRAGRRHGAASSEALSPLLPPRVGLERTAR